MMITATTDGNQDANLLSTLQVTNNGSTSSATAEDDDDATVQTSNSNSTTQAWTSYNIKLLLTSKRDTSVFHEGARVKNRVTLIHWMKDNQTDDIRVFKALEVSKESSYFCFSSKDRTSKVVRVVGSKQVFFEALIDKTRFPVLKACRILCRLDDDTSDTSSDNNNNNNNNTSSIEEYKMDPIKKMITTTTDGNQDANLPSALQVTNNGSTSSTTAEDDDDATVQTSNSNSTKQAWTSYNIKLLLTSKRDTSDSALEHAMLTILATIDRELGADTTIFDGNKQQVTDFKFEEVTLF
jgi:hypothetical protein